MDVVNQEMYCLMRKLLVTVAVQLPCGPRDGRVLDAVFGTQHMSHRANGVI